MVIAVQVEADTFIIAREEMNMSFENRNTARMENKTRPEKVSGLRIKWIVLKIR